MAFNRLARGLVILVGEQQNSGKAERPSLGECRPQYAMAVPFATPTRSNVIADVSSFVRQKRRVDVVPDAGHAYHDRRVLHQPAVRARHIPLTQIRASFFIQQSADVLVNAD